MKKGIVFACILVLMSFFSTIALSGQSLEDKIMSVSPGMKKAEALAILGKPGSILSKSLNSQSKVVEVWQYDTVSNGTDPLTGALKSLGIQDTADVQLERERVKARQREANPPYIVTMVDGVVQSIGRGISNTPDATVRIE